jgi:putative peptidoglycan lipid II flippase
LPNLFRRLFAEGAFNSAFVPMYARTLEGGGEEDARRFAALVFSGLTLVLVLFSAVAMIFAPWLVTLLAPGYLEDPVKFDLTVQLTLICFPYLAFVSLTAMLGGVLNAHRKFFLAALAPVALNLITVAALLLVSWLQLANTREAAVILCASVTVAGLAQVVMVGWGVWRSGWGFKLVRPRWTPDMARLVKLGLPGAIAGGVTQINIVIGTMIASTQASANSYLYFADRIYQLPLGVVGIAIGVVLLPEIARLVQAGRPEIANHQQNRSFEFAMALTLPASVALVVAAGPIIEVLFERGAFTANDTAQTAIVLAIFGFGLPSFVLIKVFSPGFFAREDTRTPMLFGFVSMAVNVVGSAATWWFAPESVHIGIAAATTLSGWVNAALLYVELRKRGHWTADAGVIRSLPRQIISALVMGALVAGLVMGLAPWLGAERGFLVKFAALGFVCAVGMAVFFGLGHLIGAFDLRQVRGQMRRRSGGASPAPTGSD